MIHLISKKDHFQSFFDDRVTKNAIFISLFLNIILWGMLGWQVKDFPELIPLHYNIYFGIDLLGHWYQIFLLPGLGLIVLVLNFFLSIFLFVRSPEQKIFNYFLLGSAALVQVLLLMSASAIIYFSL